MKIAICLYGYFNNSRQPDSGMNGSRYIKKSILEKSKGHQVDIFIHSWEKKNENLYQKLFNPKEMVFEDQIDFRKVMEKNFISNEYFDFVDGFDRKSSPFAACKIESTLSFLYSRAASLEIMRSFGSYDVVLTSRFDLGQIDSGSDRRYKVSLIDFQPELDMNWIYSAMWDQLNQGYADQWFYSNQDNMLKLVDLYHNACEIYFKPGSEYERVLTTGFPDSKNHIQSFTAPEQFSNEMLAKEKTKDLMKFSRWQCINNHILHKWHFIQCGLYEKSKFLEGRP